jgi:hypothetical protein
MAPNTVSGKTGQKKSYLSENKGYALLLAIIALNVLTILLLAARTLWETEIRRDLEEELIFRARQYVQAIEGYKKKNNNLDPKDFKTLVEKKFLRKLYPDPLSDSGRWDVVMQPKFTGNKTLMVVPEEMVPQYLYQARIVGVISTCPDDAFKVYRKKTKYNEWAFYVGDDEEKDMPQLKFISRK